MNLREFIKDYQAKSETPTMGVSEYLEIMRSASSTIRLLLVVNDMDAIEDEVRAIKEKVGYWQLTQEQFDTFLSSELWEKRQSRQVRKVFFYKIYSDILSLDFFAEMKDSECRLICLSLQDRAKDIISYFTRFLDEYGADIEVALGCKVENKNVSKCNSRGRSFASFFVNAQDIKEVIANAPTEDETKLANYFDTLVRQGKLTDIPTQSALKSYGILVSDDWRGKCNTRRYNRNISQRK